MSTHELVTVDCEYLRTGFAAAYLRIAGEEAAFIETNTAHAAPKLLGALAHRGLHPEQVRWIAVTHAHLDHAGGAGVLMRACPNATLLAHPRAARHLIDPSKLVQSATKVYGEARFGALYGTVEPVPVERVQPIDEEATVVLGDASLHFFHVRGHANHHFIIHDPALDAVFTGDAFGLVYPALQRPGPFAFPSTSPTDFDPTAARRAVDRIVSLGARAAFLTHFGEVRAIDAVAAQLHGWIDLSEAALEEAVSSELAGQAMERAIAGTLWAAFERLANAAGFSLTDDDRTLLELDVGLNAQGIAWAADKRRTSSS